MGSASAIGLWLKVLFRRNAFGFKLYSSYLSLVSALKGDAISTAPGKAFSPPITGKLGLSPSFPSSPSSTPLISSSYEFMINF